MNTNEIPCQNYAPHVFYIDRSGNGVIVQGCCNDWLCRRCGHIRANEEYHKLTFGAATLENEKHQLYFLTLTCRGKEMPLVESEQGYYMWTSRLLNSLRMKCRREFEFWSYAQVTERQKRGHPHSHLIITYVPRDAIETKKTRKGKTTTHLVSKWLKRACIRSGLGDRYDITRIKSGKAVASYISKYLYKDAILTKWPKGWRRVRYSRNWPQETSAEKPEEGWALLTELDWLRAKHTGVPLSTASLVVATQTRARGIPITHHVKAGEIQGVEIDDLCDNASIVSL